MKTVHRILAVILICGMLMSMFCGCDEEKNESASNVSVNTEVSETVSGEENSSAEISGEVSEEITVEVSDTADETSGITDETSVEVSDAVSNPDETDYSTGLEYKVNDDGKTCTIIGKGTCEDNNINIPPEIDGYQVTAIGDMAFCQAFLKWYPRDATITIPEGVVTIGSGACSSCDKLTKITVPDSIVAIGDAFRYCDNLQYNKYDNGYYLGNDNNPYLILIKVSDPSTTSIEIHPNTKIVSIVAFKDCEDLINITVSGSLSILSGLYACDNLQYNTYDNGYYLGNNDNPYFALVSTTDTSITSCKIHPDTKIITDDAFKNCENISEIVIPNGVTAIGHNAFAMCYGLSSLKIPASVTTIGVSAFAYCENLSTVNFEDDSNWYVFDIQTTTVMNSHIDVSNAKTTAEHLRNDYVICTWIKDKKQ